jgi:hypothetical protein
MSMHLEGPWLTTTGKRKGKQKFRNADQAKQARELDESWKTMLKKHGIEQEERRRKRAMNSETYHPPAVYRRETPKIASLSDGIGVAARKESQRYTGTLIKGIGTMHKSNAVPIFSDEEAQDIAKMRR